MFFCYTVLKNSDGKVKIIKKDDMKNILGRSPDILDMFIMRTYFEFKKQPDIPVRNNIMRKVARFAR